MFWYSRIAEIIVLPFSVIIYRSVFTIFFTNPCARKIRIFLVIADDSFLFSIEFAFSISERRCRHKPVVRIVYSYIKTYLFFTGGRSKKCFAELVKPWKLEEPGLLSIEEWIGVLPKVTFEMTKFTGGDGGFGGFGGFLYKWFYCFGGNDTFMKNKLLTGSEKKLSQPKNGSCNKAK